MKRSIIGILLIALSIGGMLYWEMIGRDALMYTQVLTVTRDIEEGTIITGDMLGLKKTTSPSARSLRLKDAEGLLGMEAVSYLPAGAELFREFFEEEKLVVHQEKGEYIFSIPSGWLVSYPQTLRRGDAVSLLLVRDKDRWGEEPLDPQDGPATGDEILSSTVLYVKSSSNDEVISDGDRLNAAPTVSIIEIVAQKEQAQTLTRLAAEGCRFVVLYR